MLIIYNIVSLCAYGNRAMKTFAIVSQNTRLCGSNQYPEKKKKIWIRYIVLNTCNYEIYLFSRNCILYKLREKLIVKEKCVWLTSTFTYATKETEWS